MNDTDEDLKRQTGFRIDFDNDSEYYGCSEDFATRAEAEAELDRLRTTPGEIELGANAVVCSVRRATPAEIGAVPDIEDLVETMDDGREGACPRVFGHWDDAMLHLRDDGSVQRIIDAINAELVVEAWVLTPVEES